MADFSSSSFGEYRTEHSLFLWVVSIAILTGLSIRLLASYMSGGVCRCQTRLDGKTAIVTGANSGIGKAAAQDFARRGARVIMACRDLDNAEEAAIEIRTQTGNGNVIVRQLDLASLESIRKFAANINEEEERVDILLNNAGIMMSAFSLTEDGFEKQFGTNHLGHFLLTHLLMDLVKKSAPSRVISVSSMAHMSGKLHNLENLHKKESYSRLQAYFDSKLANVLFVHELAKRYKGAGVTAYSVHPGAVNTRLGRYIPKIFLHIFHLGIVTSIVKTPLMGAQTSIHCAVSPDIDHLSGKYFSDCKEKAAKNVNDDVAANLWDYSMKAVGLET